MMWTEEENKLMERYFKTGVTEMTLFKNIHKINPYRTYEAMMRRIRLMKEKGYSRNKDNAMKKLRIGYLDIEATNLNANFGFMLSWYIKREGKNEYDYSVIKKSEIFNYKFDERLVKARGHQGMVECAKNVRKIVEGSEILEQEQKRVQDAYSLRSTPQVTGAVRDTVKFVKKMIETELNGVCDNPLFIPDTEKGTYIPGANFQGSPIGLALDSLGIAVTTLGGLSERRLNRLNNQVN